MDQNINVADEIRKLKELLDIGGITQEEFDTQKQMLLKPTSPQPSSIPGSPVQPMRKRKRHGCLTAFLIVILLEVVVALICAIYQLITGVSPFPASMLEDSSQASSSSVHSTASMESTASLSDEEYQSALLEFDSRTWEDFEKLYVSHNNFIKLIGKFSSQSIDMSTFYDECKKAKEYFQEASTCLDYGTTEEENTYLSSFEIAVLSDQQAAESLLKYFDSQKPKDIEKCAEYIERSKAAYVQIASNRGKLLVKAGLTDEEIKTLVDADMAELDSKTNPEAKE